MQSVWCPENKDLALISEILWKRVRTCCYTQEFVLLRKDAAGCCDRGFVIKESVEMSHS